MKAIVRALLIGSIFGAAGCGTDTGTLKGSLVDGGKPVGSEGQQVSLSFHPRKPDGAFDEGNCSTAVLNGNGSFEFVASGGTLKPGTYRVVIAGASSASGPGTQSTAKEKSKKPDRFAGHSTFAASKLTVTIVAGKNDVVIDLSKPAG